MGKKKGGTSKVAAKAAKQAKAAQKTERKEKKKSGRSKDEEDGEDLELILEKMRQEWEEAHTVTEELVEGPPSRRANATLTPCPNGNHLWCIGGEFFSEDGRAYFYNDVFRYSPDKDEWRKFVSPTCPGPRSAHAVVASPAGGGKLFLFGGEFSSLHQTTFHHYRDFWCFDIGTHSWDRVDTKVVPTARSGHRMAIWKTYIILFGGFYDPGITSLAADFLFSQRLTALYSMVHTTFEGLIINSPIKKGGYCKEYAKGKRPVGVMLEDTWFLNLSFKTAEESAGCSSKVKLPLKVKWERRKRPSTAYAPALRSGCTMALWQAKNMGILFGGVTDEDNHEETLDSFFWNDLHGYQLTGKGRWVSLNLKRPKKKGGAAKKKKAQGQASNERHNDDEFDGDDDETATQVGLEVDPDDPNLTAPIPRYNAMLSVLRNTLFIYGGIFEKGSKEYTLDDFYSLQLDKLDKYTCLKSSGIVIAEEEVSSSEDDDDEEGSDTDDEDIDFDDTGTLVDEEMETVMAKHKLEDDIDEVIDEESDDEVVTVAELKPQQEQEQDALRAEATAFMGVSKDSARSAEDVNSTPLPGETLAMFYARTREYWGQAAYQKVSGRDIRGKELQRHGFTLAQERYESYKPILAEVEKILAEAGLDEEEMRRGAASGPASGQGQNRNRR
ncbi:hypothetical protein HGRIS_000249 [Hohenbuehelia grisea]|uniref:DUF4110 domain-containing protein n=1 Tax=Hohenbuehelia grisea TaxID=104357 RepID=A0ABR3JR94_9AGAR